MTQLQAKVEGDALIITIPFDKVGYKTEKGNTVHATTHGNKTLDVAGHGSLTFGLTAYTKR